MRWRGWRKRRHAGLAALGGLAIATVILWRSSQPAVPAQATIVDYADRYMPLLLIHFDGAYPTAITAPPPTVTPTRPTHTPFPTRTRTPTVTPGPSPTATLPGGVVSHPGGADI